MGIRDQPTAAWSPLQNGYAKRRRRALSLAFLPRVSHRTTTSRDILRPWLCRSSSPLPRGDEAPSFVSRCRHAYVAGSNSGTINEKRQTPLARP
jgi:hypothetical protein